MPIKQALKFLAVSCFVFLSMSIVSCDEDGVDEETNIPVGERWKEIFLEVPAMITPRNGGQPFMLSDGRLLVIGGYVDNRPPDDVALFCEFYDQDTKKWTETNWKFDLKGYGAYRLGGGAYVDSQSAILELPNGHIIIAGGYGSKGYSRGWYELNPNDPNPANIKFTAFSGMSDPAHISPTGVALLDDGSLVMAGGGYIRVIKDGVTTEVYTDNRDKMSWTNIVAMGGRKFYAFQDGIYLMYDLDVSLQGWMHYWFDTSNNGALETMSVKIADSVFVMGGGFNNNSSIGAELIGMHPQIVDFHTAVRTGVDKNFVKVKPFASMFPDANHSNEMNDICKLSDGTYHMFIQDESFIYNAATNTLTKGYTWSEKDQKFYSVPDYLYIAATYQAVPLPSGDLFLTYTVHINEAKKPTTTYYILKKI